MIMNSKPNVPGEIFLGDKEYSWRMDWKVNGWLFVATLISALGDIIFRDVVKQWPLDWRVGLVLLEFIAIALWSHSLIRWIRGMDEMHRRITVSAILFALSATFFVAMLWHGLDRAGFLDAIFSKPGKGGNWDICTIGHEFLLLTVFYFVGYSIFNRRYK
jgi:hypothetical protein